MVINGALGWDHRLRLQSRSRRVAAATGEETKPRTASGTWAWASLLLLWYSGLICWISRDCSAEGSSPTSTHFLIQPKKDHKKRKRKKHSRWVGSVFSFWYYQNLWPLPLLRKKKEEEDKREKWRRQKGRMEFRAWDQMKRKKQWDKLVGWEGFNKRERIQRKRKYRVYTDQTRTRPLPLVCLFICFFSFFSIDSTKKISATKRLEIYCFFTWSEV